MAKSNRLRNIPKREKRKKDKKRSSKKKIRFKNPLAKPIAAVKGFFSDERVSKVTGLLFMLFSVYLLIAFASFLFTWQADQDKLANGLWELIRNREVEVDNWLGKIGAVTAHQFIHNWFGIASFLFVLNFFVIGFRFLFKLGILPIRKMLKYSFFSLLWISLMFGFLFQENNFFIGGAFGYQANLWLSSAIGRIGTGFFLLFTASAFVIVFFNPSFALLSQWPGIRKKETEGEHSDSEAITEEQRAAVNALREEKNEEEDRVTADPASESDPTEGHATETDGTDHSDPTPGSGLPASTDIELDIEIPETSEPPVGEDLSMEVTVVQEESSEDKINEKLREFGEYDPKLDLAKYELPPIDLLEAHGGSGINVNKEELEANKNKILETLRNYNIEISKIKATVGPTVTLYEIIPAPGIRIAKIKNLEDDIALSLAALGIRIIAPIPGKGTIGIEVPNGKPETVAMKTVLASDKFRNADMALPVAIGKTIQNENFVTDLAKMPHLLMAGATGQGKSVGLNTILVSLLYKKHPAQVKFVLVDPKKVELTLFNKIERHFLARLPDSEEPIITDTSKVVATVNSLCKEMDARYELLKNAHVRNLKEYNAKFVARRLNPENGHKYLPYIVLVVDEFADLIMTAGKEIEQPIARLAQLARAIGIHLIIATQRPSVNIITGTIKANFPARIAFRVTSKIDSRTILDAGGADQLIGRGDMLLSTGSDLIRLQCAFVDTPEVDRICDFIGNQRGYPDAFLLPEYDDENAEGSGNVDLEERDAKFDDAARIVVLHQQGSASLLQRKLKLGYNRAGRLVDQLEAAGIIGPFEGSKARKVLIPDEYSLEQMLNRGASSDRKE